MQTGKSVPHSSRLYRDEWAARSRGSRLWRAARKWALPADLPPITCTHTAQKSPKNAVEIPRITAPDFDPLNLLGLNSQMREDYSDLFSQSAKTTATNHYRFAKFLAHTLKESRNSERTFQRFRAIPASRSATKKVILSEPFRCLSIVVPAPRPGQSTPPKIPRVSLIGYQTRNPSQSADYFSEIARLVSAAKKPRRGTQPPEASPLTAGRILIRITTC
jgi:hypothetical protein